MSCSRWAENTRGYAGKVCSRPRHCGIQSYRRKSLKHKTSRKRSNCPSKETGQFQSGALRALDREVDYPAGVGVGVADVGIEIVWPACNLRPSSMWFAFCNSSTVTLYIFAMDVSVSPRATVCTLPAAGWEGDAPGATGLACAGVLSPIMTPGRMCETCCSSLRIS